jgi:hypothetical protein
MSVSDIWGNPGGYAIPDFGDAQSGLCAARAIRFIPQKNHVGTAR